MALPFLIQQKKRIDQVVAIDLGARQTKAVRVQRKQERLSLLGYTVLEAPSREKGLKVPVLADHLKKVFEPLGEGSYEIALAVGYPEAFLRRAELPPMPIPDMRQMLRLNSKTYLQQDFPDHVFDCAVIVSKMEPEKTQVPKPPQDAGPTKQKLLVGGIKRQALDDLKAACKAAGVLAHQITPGMAGPVNAFEAAEPDLFAREVLALVDIGFKNTTITMLNHGEVVMNRVVALAGDHLTASLVEARGITYTEAESLKIGSAEDVQQALEPVLASLGRELRASVDFFEHQHDVTVNRIFMSGGSVGNEFILHSLQRELMMTCNTWNPAQRLQLSLPIEQRAGLEQVAPLLAVVIGTAVAVF